MTFALRTPRLLLRQWRDADAAAFAAMSADSGLTEFLLPPAADWIARARAHWDEHGFGQFVVAIPGEADFIGVIGLGHIRWAMPFGPAVEVAWRLARPYWGRGYASEGARAALDDGFGRLGFGETVAVTVTGNRRSRAVMERLGMTRDPSGDFDHPVFEGNHPLRRHVLYRLSSGKR